MLLMHNIMPLVTSAKNQWCSSNTLVSHRNPNSKALSHLRVERKSDKVELLRSDSILRDWWEKPVVVEEYSLIFFPLPKVACTEFKLLFHRMMGLEYTLPSIGNVHRIQNPSVNKLKTLDEYPIWKAEEMLNSEQYKKAVFVREPKERILSAFLNKFVMDRFYFRGICCSQLIQEKDQNHCDDMMYEKNFSYFLEATHQWCFDNHWEPQYFMIDKKWWSRIDFVGQFHNIFNDSQTLLKSLVSKKDGLTAWDKVGKDGWDHNQAFMESNSAGHATNTTAKMLQYYTRELELLVEEKYAVEWQHEELGLENIHLFH